MKKFTLDNLKEIINKQFEINGINLKFEDVQGSNDWFTVNTTTIDKELEFTEWLISYLKKYTKYPKKEAQLIILNYGLRTLG